MPRQSVSSWSAVLALAIVLSLGSVAPADDPTPAADSATIEAIEAIGGSVLSIGDGLEVAFHLRGRDLTNEGLAHVAKLDNVVVLNLKETKISSAGLAHVKQLTSLRRLHLELTSIDDRGVEHLTELANLEYLNLYGTKVSDAGLAKLAKLTKLKRLYVWQTKVTDKSVNALSETLPQLEIVRGVDLSTLPTYEELEADKPKPTEDLKWIATGDRNAAPKSESGDNTQVFFENKSKQRVKIYWVSYDDQLQLYAELEPGKVHQQNTYSRNTWLIADVNDTPLGYFLVGTKIARATIPRLDE